MSTTTDISQSYVQGYRSAVELLAQQKGSKLAGTTDVEAVDGEATYWDQVGEVHAEELATRYADTPRMDPKLGRRQLTTTFWVVSSLVTKPDLIRTLDDPTNKYVMAQAASLGRVQDQVLIDAMRGTAYTGKKGETAIALPSTQKVAVASSGLTLAKLLNAMEILDGNDVDPEDRYIAPTAKQMTNLLNTTEVKSSDYNTVKALVRGEIDTFLKFKFVPVNGKRRDGSKIVPLITEGVRAVMCWQKMHVLLGAGQNPNFRITERADKNYAVQAYGSEDVGGTRMQEEGVVEIACLES